VKSSTLLAVVLVIIGVGSLVGAFAYQACVLRPIGQQSQYPSSELPYPPMVTSKDGNGYGGMMGRGATTTGQLVTIQQAEQQMQNVPSYAKVISTNNTVVFDSQQISIFVLALMPDKAVNLTGRQMPTYATDDVFVIYGLINPTLVMRGGASVQFTVVNLDDDMYHNLVVSTYAPPYGSMPMQAMMSGYWMPYLPPADYNQGSAHEYSYTLPLSQAGTYWYFCTFPDHAQTGMYGKIMVAN
jgi:rusticyanin